jgi:tRNA dimethylallyltransferase
MEDHFQLIKMKRLLVIGGPTAGGKTSLSIALAKHFNTVILSADSRQFYKEMNIGTAKPSVEEQNGIPHFFVDSHSIHEALTAAQYANQALEVLNDQFQQHDTIILTGGSGMFIDALCKGLDNIPHSTEIRDQLTAQWKSNGLEFIQEKLKVADPDYYDQVDRQNPVRIIRALEAIEITGKPFSSLRKSTSERRPFALQYVIIEHNRDALYKRIDQRVDKMIENGLLDEAKALMPFRNLNALNTVGYVELFDYFEGTLSLEEAIEKIKQNTRNYAKRQITWCRRYTDALRIEHTADINEMKNVLLPHLPLGENECR